MGNLTKILPEIRRRSSNNRSKRGLVVLLLLNRGRRRWPGETGEIGIMNCNIIHKIRIAHPTRVSRWRHFFPFHSISNWFPRNILWVCFFCSNFPGKQTGERRKGLYIGVGVSGLCFFFSSWGGSRRGFDWWKKVVVVVKIRSSCCTPPVSAFFGLFSLGFYQWILFLGVAFFFLIFFTNAEIICGDDVRVDLTINSLEHSCRI